MTPELNKSDIQKIENLIADRKRGHAYFEQRSKVYNAFIDLENQAYAVGKLGKKYKEMVAIGISIYINCESCMEWHIREALSSGGTKEEIIEAIGVGMEMGGGPATVASRFAMKVIEYHTQEHPR
ncbi:MAG: carboxymuconolactone decarboxylase family protein [Cyclobacteriaceae bacterium]|nr:carboxymuconolactone decarboxylase family protein [Cyclobacteriaceae bacterium]